MTYREDRTVIIRCSSEVSKGELYGSFLFNIIAELAQEQTPYLLLVLPTQKMTSFWH